MVLAMLSEQQLAQIDGAAVGVLGHVTGSGLPNALAVTPYVVDGTLVVTSTLALIDKAAAIRRDPRVALSAGGVSVSGTASVEVDPTSRWFDRFIRSQEIVKYPPSRSLLALPLHRRVLPWYVGRVIMRISVDAVTDQPCGDGTTVTHLDAAGRLSTANLPQPDDLAAERVDLAAAVPDGPALLLVHVEDAAMRDLRQLGLRGDVQRGVLHVTARRGTLTPSSTGAVDHVRQLRSLARRARANREQLTAWPTYDPSEGGAR